MHHVLITMSMTTMSFHLYIHLWSLFIGIMKLILDRFEHYNLVKFVDNIMNFVASRINRFLVANFFFYFEIMSMHRTITKFLIPQKNYYDIKLALYQNKKYQVSKVIPLTQSNLWMTNTSFLCNITMTQHPINTTNDQIVITSKGLISFHWLH